MPTKNVVAVRICSECGYPARDTDAAEFCPGCGEIGTFVQTTISDKDNTVAA